MNSCKKLLGKRIKELRKSRNLTQEKLAELIGFEPNHVTKIEAGVHFPQPEKLEKLAQIFDLQVKDLFDFEHKLPTENLRQKITAWLNDATPAELEYIFKTIKNLDEFKQNSPKK